MARAGVLLLCLSLFLSISFSHAADIDLAKTKEAFIAGKYAEVIQQCREALDARLRTEDWHLLLAKSLWITGQYPEAKEAITRAERGYYSSVRIRLLGYQVCRSAGDLETAQRLLDEINVLGGSRRFGLENRRSRRTGRSSGPSRRRSEAGAGQLLHSGQTQRSEPARGLPGHRKPRLAEA